MLAPAAILARLDNRLALLVGGPRDVPARHRTLRAAIAWSYDLLLPPEQRWFGRLSVFQGGATPAAIAAVCAGGDEPATNVEELLESHITPPSAAG